ncbi:MAG: hypothetical protein WDW36_009255 [Sanguina aurantia]
MITLVEGATQQQRPVASAQRAAAADRTALEEATAVIARHLRACTATSADPVTDNVILAQQGLGCGAGGDSRSCPGASHIRDLQSLARRALEAQP